MEVGACRYKFTTLILSKKITPLMESKKIYKARKIFVMDFVAILSMSLFKTIMNYDCGFNRKSKLSKARFYFPSFGNISVFIGLIYYVRGHICHKQVLS